MKKKDRSLPRPSKTPFGRNRAGEEENNQELLADRMAEAAALGNLDQLLDRELPDSEHARALANMMMGMTGMLPQESGPSPASPVEAAGPEPAERPSPDAPPGVREAVLSGDVQGLIEMLRQEHRKRSGGAETSPAAAASEPPAASGAAEGLPPEEKAVLDRLVALAREHRVSPDWIILRALKLYLEEYERTGRL